MREITKRAAGIMAQVWGIGERKFGGDWERRMMLFNVLVKSIIMYGVDVWGWQERKKLKDLQTRYIRRTLGLDKCKPRYVIIGETKVESISIEERYRALKYQDKVRKRGENKLLKECWGEVDSEYWKATN